LVVFHLIAMLRVLGLTLGTVVAVRKGGVTPDVSQPANQELTNALLQKGKKFEARSLLDVMDGLTPYVASNISAVVTEMEQTVLKSIRDAHSATVALLADYVYQFEVKVNESSDKKTTANSMDEALINCVGDEKSEIQTTIAKQNTYNLKELATHVPCREEVDTAHPTAKTSEQPIAEECNTDVDEDCAVAKAHVASNLSHIQTQLKDSLEADLRLHQAAERRCTWAKGNASAALSAVETQQDVWNGKYDECVIAKGDRNSAVCDFGEKLQDACDDLAKYEELVSWVSGSGTIHSIKDRQDEAVAVKTVLCVLNDFIAGRDITESSTQACHQAADLAEFDIDLSAIATQVGNIKAVHHNAALEVKCLNEENHRFKGGAWDSPIVNPKPDGYTNHTIPSAENVTLQEYQWNDVWEQKVDLLNSNLPFPVCSR